MPSTSALTPEQMATFRERGYVVIENAFDQNDAARYVHAMLRLVEAQHCNAIKLPAEWPELPPSDLYGILLDSLMTLELTNHVYISRIYDTIRDTPALRSMLLKPAVIDAAVQMMDLPPHSPLYLQQAACRIDVPHDKAFTLDWHQEVHYTYKGSQFVQLWAPALTDITRENGAMLILPKSHNFGVAPTNDFVPEFGHAQYTVVPEVVAQYEPMEVSMKFGQALLFHNALVHKSGVNSSKRPRLTLLAHYHNPCKEGFFENIKPHGTAKNSYKE